MTANGGVAIVVIVWSVGVWYALCKIVPRNMMSVYRYRLWRFRDRLRDDLTDGKLPRVRSVAFILNSYEEAIRHAEETSFLNLVTRGALKRLDEEENASLAMFRKERDSLPLRERRLLISYEEHLTRAMGLRIFLGTPSGWLGTLTSPVWLPFILIRDRKVLFDSGMRNMDIAKRVRRGSHVQHDGPLPVT